MSDCTCVSLVAIVNYTHYLRYFLLKSWLNMLCKRVSYVYWAGLSSKWVNVCLRLRWTPGRFINAPPRLIHHSSLSSSFSSVNHAHFNSFSLCGKTEKRAVFERCYLVTKYKLYWRFNIYIFFFLACVFARINAHIRKRWNSHVKNYIFINTI